MRLSARQIKSVEVAPAAFRRLYRRCLRGKATPEDLLLCMCLFCTDWGRQGEQLEDCDARACPIWQHRATYVKKRLESLRQAFPCVYS